MKFPKLFEGDVPDYVDPEKKRAEEKKESEMEKQKNNEENEASSEMTNREEKGDTKKNGIYEKMKVLASNPDFQKRFAKGMVSTALSVTGLKSVFDLVSYVNQSRKVRGMFGEGKGLVGSVEDLINASLSADEKRKNSRSRTGYRGNLVDSDGELKKGDPNRIEYQTRDIGIDRKKGDIHAAIKDLNERLSLTQEGERRGSEQRHKIAQILKEHRRNRLEGNGREDVGFSQLLEEAKLNGDEAVQNIVSEYEQNKQARLENARERMTDVLDNYTTQKVTGMQVAKEAINTVCVASGAGLGGVLYTGGIVSKGLVYRTLANGLMDAWGRYKKLEIESKRKASDGEMIKNPKWLSEVIGGAIKETFNEAFSKQSSIDQGDVKKVGSAKIIDKVKAWSNIARYAGFLAFSPDRIHDSVEDLLKVVDDKDNLYASSENLKPAKHVDLSSTLFKTDSRTSFEAVDSRFNPQHLESQKNPLEIKHNPSLLRNHGNNLEEGVQDPKAEEIQKLRVEKKIKTKLADSEEKIIKKDIDTTVSNAKPDIKPEVQPKVESAEQYRAQLINIASLEDQRRQIIEKMHELSDQEETMIEKGGTRESLTLSAEQKKLVELDEKIQQERDKLVEIFHKGEEFTPVGNVESNEAGTDDSGAEVNEAVKNVNQGEVQRAVEEKPSKIAEHENTLEQATGKLDHVTKLKNGKVLFRYDDKGEIIDGRIDTKAIGGIREGVSYRTKDAYQNLFEANARPLMRSHVDNVNVSINGSMRLYNELLANGYKKEANYVLKTVYQSMDMTEKGLNGIKIFDRSKLPSLG